MIQHECAVKFCFPHRARRRAAAAEMEPRRARTVLVEAEAEAALGPRTRARAARPGAEAAPLVEEEEADDPDRLGHVAAERHEAAVAAAALGRRAGLQRRAARRAVPHPRP